MKHPGLKKLFLLASVALSAGLLSGCGDNNSNGSTSTDAEQPISTEVLSSAASFLGAAAGKETPLTIDTLVFINSAMGINQLGDDKAPARPEEGLFAKSAGEFEIDPQNLFGDLWQIVRNENGEPVLDDNGCIQPVASEPVIWPDDIERDTVPMVLEEFMDSDFKCSVLEGYEEFTIELEIGRLNMIRRMVTEPEAFARSLQEVIDNINAAISVTADPAGRLVLLVDEDGELVEKTIDSPRESLALFHALMKYGRVVGYGPERHEGGNVLPPEWLEIRPDLELGDFAYLRDGTPGRDGGVGLINGYADLSGMVHSRKKDYQDLLINYIQYIEGPICNYWDLEDFAWDRVFDSEPYNGVNIDAFTTHADDARRTIVFMHDVIQDMPETELATLPTPAGNRVGLMEAAATFLGGASNKGVPLKVDGLIFINTVLGLNDVDFNFKGEIFGDLWELVRNDNGEPILDANSCPQPVSSETITWPDAIERDTVPMELDEHNDCVVVAGYEDYVVELELGRLNGVRVALTNPRVLHRHLYDVVNSLNNSLGVKLDLAGRLAYAVDEDGEIVYKTVDSPRAGLALYWALMEWGKIEGEIEIMDEGTWVSTPVSITLDDAVLDAEGLGYLKHGNAACQANPADCGVTRLPSGFVDYSAFTHKTEDVFGGVNVSYVERQDDLACGYTDKTDDLWERVLGSDAYDGMNIEAFVKMAEDGRTVIQFIHTVIQDPVVDI